MVPACSGQGCDGQTLDQEGILTGAGLFRVGLRLGQTLDQFRLSRVHLLCYDVRLFPGHGWSRCSGGHRRGLCGWWFSDLKNNRPYLISHL